MTKAEIVESISNECNVTKKDIAFIIDSLFKKVKVGISENKHIELRGFGTFGTKKRKPRNSKKS